MPNGDDAGARLLASMGWIAWEGFEKSYFTDGVGFAPWAFVVIICTLFYSAALSPWLYVRFRAAGR